MTGLGAIAAWTGPALVVAVVARMMTGGVEAPLFVLAVLAAPLLALLIGPTTRVTRSGFAVTVGLVTAACVLGAGFRAVTDLGHALGLEAGATLGSVVALVLVTTMWPGHHRVAAAALVLGGTAFVVALVILGVAVAVTPWEAWSRVASRSAFELGPRSPWTREGAQFREPVTLTFSEPHQVTAAGQTVLRVTEHDRPLPVVREWRLAAGESLVLRSGDALSIPAEARVRFEKGKRVPGALVSGVAWADRPGQTRARLLIWWLGLSVTLTGGVLMIIGLPAPVSRASALLAPVAVLGVVLAAACWGVYTVAAAPELSIGTSASALLARLGSVVADDPWRSRVLVAVVVALVALLLGSAASLRQRLVDLAALVPGRLETAGHGGMLGTVTWLAVVAGAAAGSVVAADGWSLFLLGVGLAAATLLGPLVATGDRPGLGAASARGALTGVTLFLILAAVAHWPSTPVRGLAALAQYPALVAVPVAWLVTTLSRPPRRARR